MKKIFYLILLSITASCNRTETRSDTHQSDTTISLAKVKTSGSEAEIPEDSILMLKTDSAFINEVGFAVLNLDKSPFTEIIGTEYTEPSSSKLKDDILAYYPEYYIIHFQANIASDSLYRVKIKGQDKLIKKGRFMEYISWPEYILRFYAITDDSNPLRDIPAVSGNILKGLNYEALGFICTEISGDWVKVKCFKECEGCPGGKEISGWLRWRKNGKVILKQKYTC